MTRDRGTYGPIDRGRHLLVDWGADYAVDYARARAEAVAAPAADLALRAAQSTRRAWGSARALADAAGKPTHVVGQELFHTIADRDRAIASLSTGFRALASDLAVWQTANLDKPNASATAQWLAADVTPTLEEFKDFVTHERASWWTRFATSWEAFEEWWGRLKQMRSLARAHGVELQSADPVPLPKTIWQRSAEGKGSEATALLGVLKIGAFTVLGLMGVAGIIEVVHKVRPKKQPIDENVLRKIIQEEIRSR